MNNRLTTAAVCLLATAPAAFAHKMDATCTPRGDAIVVEVFYVAYTGEPEPGQGVRVCLERDGGEGVTEGRTDAKGVWQFPRPAPGRYTVFANDGDGHTATSAFLITTDNEFVALTEDPGRTAEDANRFPFVKVGLGLGAIALVAGLGWWVLHDRAARQRQAGPQP